MPLKYTIFWHLSCDQESCVNNTTTRIDDSKVIEEAENDGWRTPDGLNWYCPTHSGDIPK